MTAHIPLTKGLFAIINGCDADRVAKFKWHALKRRLRSYAGTNIPGSGNRSGGHNKRMIHVSLHRFITGAANGQIVDHVNGDGLDCRRENLRLCSQAENTRNRRISSGASKFKGVYWRKDLGKWVAAIQHKTLGFFLNEVDAAAAYDKAAIGAYGEFAALNLTGEITHIDDAIAEERNS